MGDWIERGLTGGVELQASARRTASRRRTIACEQTLHHVPARRFDDIHPTYSASATGVRAASSVANSPLDGPAGPCPRPSVSTSQRRKRKRAAFAGLGGSRNICSSLS